MDKEYLQDYQARENEECNRLLTKKIEDGSFDITKDKYPPDNRFINLQHPVTDTTAIGCYAEDRWSQVPFCGSTVISIDACSPEIFEEFYFKISEIPKVIDFIKETGRMQIALQQPADLYEGIDFLDPFFKELRPPIINALSYAPVGAEKEFKSARDLFYTLSKVKFLDSFSKIVAKRLKDYS